LSKQSELPKLFFCAIFTAAGLFAQQAKDAGTSPRSNVSSITLPVLTSSMYRPLALSTSLLPVSATPAKPAATKAPSASASSACGTASGTQFNLEGPNNPVPQDEPPVDFLYNRIPASQGGNTDLIVQQANDWRGLGYAPNYQTTAIYVHRSDATTCSPDFEMGNAPISGMISEYDSQVAADANNDQFFLSDIVYGSSKSGVGLRRIPSANLLSTSTCPNGTLTISQAEVCSGPNALVLDQGSNIADWTGLAQDPRPVMSGTGSGDVYVVNISEASPSSSAVHLTACKGLFASASDCSPTITVSTEVMEVAPRVSVVPGGPNQGTITVTYSANDTTSSGCGTGNAICNDIKFVVCTPNGAPVAPTCGAPILVAVEQNPVGRILDNRFPIYTVPALATRADGSTGQTTFVLWNRCKINPSSYTLSGYNCPDSDILMAWSTDLGNTWTQTGFVTAGRHQFMPNIGVDASTGVTNIVYNAMMDYFNTQDYVVLRQIPAGSTTPGPYVFVTNFPNNPESDPHLAATEIYGDYINVAVKGTGSSGGSHAYVGHTKATRLGSYGSAGISAPDMNNHVSLVTY